MKLLRIGEPNQEIVAALDNNKKLRDLSGYIKDLNPKTLNENTLKKLQNIDLAKLKEIDNNQSHFNFIIHFVCTVSFYN